MQLHVGAGMRRAELHAVASGLGWGTDADNCAEFCSTEHAFAVRAALDAGGAFYVSRTAGAAWLNLTRAGADGGCAEQMLPPPRPPSPRPGSRLCPRPPHPCGTPERLRL